VTKITCHVDMSTVSNFFISQLHHFNAVLRPTFIRKHCY